MVSHSRASLTQGFLNTWPHNSRLVKGIDYLSGSSSVFGLASTKAAIHQLRQKLVLVGVGRPGLDSCPPPALE